MAKKKQSNYHNEGKEIKEVNTRDTCMCVCEWHRGRMWHLYILAH